MGDADRNRCAGEDRRFDLERKAVVVVDAQPLENVADPVAPRFVFTAGLSFFASSSASLLFSMPTPLSAIWICT